MKIREITRRIRVESAYLNPVLLGICTGAAVLFGALCMSGFIIRPVGAFLPRTALPAFLHILFQLIAYAMLGAGFSALVTAPHCRSSTTERYPWKTVGLIFFVCTLVLAYLWMPVVCRARSFFLGTLLCGILLLCVAAIFLLTRRISILSVLTVFFFGIWVFYLLYLTISLLFFA